MENIVTQGTTQTFKEESVTENNSQNSSSIKENDYGKE